MSITIDALDAAEARAALPDLVALLEDAVTGGASIGFLLPLVDGELEQYWSGVVGAVYGGGKALLVARQGRRIVGSVQVAYEPRANGSHRAEIQKLLVLGAMRRQGVGEALMRAAEAVARANRRTLLVLDTREGDDGERLYERLGFRSAGVIPLYARSVAGHLEGSRFMYKVLEDV